MILYCHRVIIAFHFQVLGPGVSFPIWNMIRSLTDHRSSSFLFFFFFSVLLAT